MTQTSAPESPKTDSKPVYARGLEGVIALQSNLAYIDGEEGTLVYRGYDIRDLAERVSYEEVVYLLWNGNLPTRNELDELNDSLQAERAVPSDVIDHLRHHTPATVHPMAALRTAVSMLAHYDEEADDPSPEANLRKAIRLVAKTPTIVAIFDRLRKGKEPVHPQGEGSLAEEFLTMLNGEAPGPEAKKIMDVALVLHAEHGLNASTFTARVIGATLSDMYSAVTGAIGALKGPLHGGANVEVMKTLIELDEAGETPEAYVAGMFENKERIMGIGHRVYKTLDPRAKILHRLLDGLSDEKGDRRWLEMSDGIANAVREEKGLNPNVDFYSASVYYLLGIERDLYTPIFVMSRMAGWTAHLLEQWGDNRLIRPRAEYVGPRDRQVTPIDDRG